MNGPPDRVATHFQLYNLIPLPIQMASAQKEAQLLLAIQAIQNMPKLSIRRVAATYNVSHTTLRARLNGRQTRRDTIPKSQKLTELEEIAIVQRVIELDS